MDKKSETLNTKIIANNLLLNDIKTKGENLGMNPSYFQSFYTQFNNKKDLHNKESIKHFAVLGTFITFKFRIAQN